MRRKTIQVILLSFLLSGSAVAISNYSQDVKVPAKAEAVEPNGVPGKVTNLSVTVSELKDDETADVVVSFTTPTDYYDDDEWDYVDGLNELTKVVIAERGGDYWDGYTYTELKTVEDPGIGVDVEVTLTGISSGEHTFAVIALNSASKSSLDNNSYSTLSKTIKVGYEAPSSVKNLAYANNYPETTLTWEAPTEGKDGGLFKQEGTTYTVYRYTGSNLTDDEEIATDLTETTFTDKFEVSTPTAVQYGVIAKNNSGSSDEVKTASFVVGPAYELPFSESFKNGFATNVWSKYVSVSTMSAATYISSYGINTGFSTKLYDGYDEDGGALCIKQNNTYYDPDDDEDVEVYATYTSAPISLKGSKVPALSFFQYILPSADNKLALSVIVEQAGEQKTVKTYTYAEGTEGWQQDAISLKEFVGDDPITIIFRADCRSSQAGFTAFDCIKIEEVLDNDLSVSALTVPEKVDAGNTFNAVATVRNNGAKDAQNFSVVLSINGETYESQNVASLAAGETTDVTFTVTAKNDFGTEAALAAKVVYDADELASNDVAEAVVAIRQAAVPTATALKAEVVDGNVELSWTAPDYELPAVETTTESFEGYANGTQSFEGWTTSALHYTAVDFTDYGLAEASWQDKNAFTVLDSATLEFDEDADDTWYGAAHTGTHYLVSTAGYWSTRNDWLISPELSGDAQTITFYAAARQQPTDSWWDSTYDEVSVYYSTTTNDKGAFAGNAVISSQKIENFLKNGDGYAQFVAELPEGAKYFAIVVTTPNESDDSIVFIDDISYTPGQTGVAVTLVGYDLYDGNNKVNSEPIVGESVILNSEDVSEGVHNYSVVAIYTAGESDASEPVQVEVETSGIKDLSNSGVRVFATQGQIHIEAQSAQVFDLSGRTIAQTTGNAVVNVLRGTYLVKANNKAFKILVK
jgi:hypothetical protein